MRPLRHYLSDRTYLITARCFEERFFLAPDSEAISVIVATSLAQAVEKYQLDLFAYVVMSNHVHLIVRAPNGGLPEAMQLFFSQVARRVNALRNRTGPVFSDRYHHQTICDAGALRNAIRYVLLNPQRAGLCAKAEEWPGLSSFADTCEDRVICCIRRTRGSNSRWSIQRVPRSELGEDGYAREEKDDGTLEERFVLSCHRASLEIGQAAQAEHESVVAALMNEKRELLEGKQDGLKRPSVSPAERPHAPKRSRAPSCIASSSASRKEFIAERRAFVAAYRVASARFRRAQTAEFPPGCCLPWPRLYSLMSCSDTNLD